MRRYLLSPFKKQDVVSDFQVHEESRIYPPKLGVGKG